MEASERYPLYWSEESKRDLLRIKRFITKNFSASVAEKSIAKVIARAIQLEEFPLSGRKDQLANALSSDLRYVIASKSRIQYIVVDKTVKIVRVHDSRQNPLNF